MADPVNILSLYSGSGMHDEAVCAALRVLGFAPRVLGYVEREASAAAWLLARMEAAAVESAPVWCGDLADMDARPLRGWIDLVVASPPCQPYSSAGKRLGNADERSHGDGDGPLPHTLRIIGECLPAVVQFENVSEWVTGGHFREFGEELCALGYDIAPPLFLAAADVGAPHERERVFIQCKLANAERRFWEPQSGRLGVCGAGGELGESGGARGGRDSRAILGPEEEGSRGRNADGDLLVGPGAANTELAIRPRGGLGIGGQSPGRDGQPDGGDEGPRREGQEPAGDSRAGGCAGELDCGMGHAERADARAGEADEQSGEGIGRRVHADTGCGIPLFPPGRNDYRRWAALVAGGLDPTCMPAIERELQHVAHGVPFSGAELLRLSGNAVVPAQAGMAFLFLLTEFQNEPAS